MIRLVTALLSMLVFTPACADVYKYVDKNGHTHFTDEPKHKGYKRIIRTRIRRPLITLSSKRGGARAKWSPSMKKNRKRYASMIQRAAKKYKVDADLLHAIIRAESAYNPNAVSHAGAVGMMQLMGPTAKRYGVVDRHDPMQNINGGANFISDLLKMFKSDLRLAVAAYNAGEGAVIKYGRKVPPYSETQNYVVKVLQYYGRQQLPKKKLKES